MWNTFGLCEREDVCVYFHTALGCGIRSQVVTEDTWCEGATSLTESFFVFQHQVGSWIRWWEPSTPLNCTLVSFTFLTHNLLSYLKPLSAAASPNLTPELLQSSSSSTCWTWNSPRIKVNLKSGADKQWMIQAFLSGWGSLSHCLLAVQL